MTRLLLCALLACGSLPHVEPKARDAHTAARAAVDIHVECEPYRDPSRGRGVLISERHILTAAHLVRCPDHPVVRVTLYDGRSMRAYVQRDEATFEGKRDGLARLVAVEPLRRFIAPPEIGGSDRWFTIARRSGTVSGDRHAIAHFFGPGDSGAAVYTSSGLLVGILLGGSSTDLEIAPVDPTWLEGT